MTSKQDLRYRKESDVARVTTMLSGYTSAKSMSGSLLTTTFDQTSNVVVNYSSTTLTFNPFRYVETSYFGSNIIVKIRYGLGTNNIPATNFTVTLTGNPDLGIGVMVTDQSGVLFSSLNQVVMNQPIPCVSSGPHVPGFLDVWYTKVQVIDEPVEDIVTKINELTVREQILSVQDQFVECPTCGRESIYKLIIDKEWCYCPIHAWINLSDMLIRDVDPEGTIYSVSNGRPIYNDQVQEYKLVKESKNRKLHIYSKAEKVNRYESGSYYNKNS